MELCKAYNYNSVKKENDTFKKDVEDYETIGNVAVSNNFNIHKVDSINQSDGSPSWHLPSNLTSAKCKYSTGAQLKCI